jgi:hypothetical protein
MSITTTVGAASQLSIALSSRSVVRKPNGWPRTPRSSSRPFVNCALLSSTLRRATLRVGRFGKHESVNVEMYYPVLVLQGQMIEVRPHKGSFATAGTAHVRCRQSLWTGTEAEDYSVDVITERYLPTFLRLVRNEVAKTASLFRRRHKEARNAIELIADAGRRLRSPRKIRQLLEF